ncbi:MAG: D-cysteine desulfhydrase family protein [Gammaproteobacteria bacterium]|nr:D-cysteine desulfhydrase family protein [Gammaproteobacteria bacterium]MYG65684.1 D-cysteine desulfhydrase family protein [Gammaproteobacteria bacterium]
MTSNPPVAAAGELLADWPRAALAHLPTPLEYLPRLSERHPGYRFWLKRDDCTGLAMGGNKVRQLEFYLGDALAKGCDTVLSTGAVQSNYMRTLAAAAARLGLECHIQLEHRVQNPPEGYHDSGNVLLDRLFGARMHALDRGEDEFGADRAIREIARSLRSQGKKPYVVPLAPVDRPLGALGYVAAAAELVQQFGEAGFRPDVLVVGSGSGLTHAGLLAGLRIMGHPLPVLGCCVRRDAGLQGDRILAHCRRIEEMLGVASCVFDDDIWVSDAALAPGYGEASNGVMRAVADMARLEGVLMDPVYSAKVVANALALVEEGELDGHRGIVLMHTGGTPALFAYRDRILSAPAFSI